jgi:hypothetical protein
VQGCEGSGNFGHPILVEDSEIVAKLLSRFERTFNKGRIGQGSGLGQLSQVQSQASILTDDTSSLQNYTLAGFSTQAPAKVPNEAVVVRHGKDTGATHKALLALLNRPKGPQTSIRTPTQARICESPYAENICDNGINEGSDSASSSSSASAQPPSMPSTTMPPFEYRGRSKTDRGHLQGNMPLSRETSELDKSESQQVGKAVDGIINNGLFSRETSLAGEIENRKGILEESDKSIGYNGIAPKPHRRVDTISQPVQENNNPWEGLPRIPRKYVQIPKDQRAILENDNAWYTQALDDRKHSIRLPSKVHQQIQAFHNTLGSRLDNGESDEEGDSGNESSNDNRSNSYNDHSEDQITDFVKDSLGMKSTMPRPVGSKSMPLSELVQSDRGKPMTHVGVTSSEPVSSDQDDSSVQGSLDITEIDLERDTGVKNTEGSCIQVDKMFPNGNVLLDTRVNVLNVSSTSLDQEDGGSADEGISWSSSPDRVERRSLQHHSIQEKEQRSTKEDQINGPDSFQSQTTLGKGSPISLMNATTRATEEDYAESEIESVSILRNQQEHQPTKSVGCMIQTLKTGIGSSNSDLSSSPVEMELSVPYALENQTQPPDDIVKTDVSSGGRPMLPTRKQHHSSFDTERALCIHSDSRSPSGNSSNTESNENNKLRQQRANVSSDPIIPGTFRSEASNTFTRPRECVSASRQPEPKSNVFETDQVISATPGPPTRFQSYASALTNVRDGKDTSSVDHTSKISVGNLQSWETNDIEISTSPTVYGPSKLCIPRSQVSTSESLIRSPDATTSNETILSTPATLFKRRATGIRDLIEPSRKRRRALQAVIFDNAPEKDSTIDPTEMAKANRRKFLQELSLSSPIQSPQRLREYNAAQLNRTSGVVAEILFENTLGRDSIRAWSGVSPPSPPRGEPERPAAHPEISCLKKPRDGLVGHPGHNAEIAYGEAPLGEEIRNGSIQNENTELFQSDGTPTVDKALSSDEHAPQTETIFDLFNKSYPKYGKSLRAFIRACVCLDWLHSTREVPHPSLWDDFIRAFSAEYLSHIKECEISKQKPLPAQEFYNTHVPEPVFMRRIMNMARLQEAFLLDPEEAARGRAKIHRKKHHNSQEPMSTTSSQITITSKNLTERQDTLSAFHEAFSSTQQLPNAAVNMSCRPSGDVGSVETVSSHIPSTVSAPHSVAAGKGRFFETPSQLVSEARRNEIPTMNRSVAAKEAPNDAFSEDPPEHAESLDIEIVRANVIKQTPRHLPWSSSSKDKLDSRDLIEVSKAIPEQSAARGQVRSSRQPGLVRSLSQQDGSPVLGSVTSNSFTTERQVVQSEISPALPSNFGFRQGHKFKAPHLPALKSLGRRMTSMPGSGNNSLDEWRTSHSIHTANASNHTVPTITATFKDFSKAFVPRQKRRSSIFSRVSTPSSDASSDRILAPNTLRCKLIAEPDTQAWRF